VLKAYRDGRLVGWLDLSGSASSVRLAGLGRGTWTFTVTATNAVGTGPESARSNPVTLR